MSKLQLIYFNLRALCEAPRMMLHTAGIEYSYEMAWDYFKKPWGDVKKEVIFHKLPLLVIDEKIEIWQSNTISRYIAKLTNNIPNNEEMVAYADSIFESAHDLFFPLRNHFCSNQGGKPRYIINNDHEFSGLECLMELKKEVAVYVERDKEKIKKYYI